MTFPELTPGAFPEIRELPMLQVSDELEFYSVAQGNPMRTYKPIFRPAIREQPGYFLPCDSPVTTEVLQDLRKHNITFLTVRIPGPRPEIHLNPYRLECHKRLTDTAMQMEALVMKRKNRKS